jgi:MFS family permease
MPFDTLREFVARVVKPFRGPRFEAEMDDELRFHIDMRADQLMRDVGAAYGGFVALVPALTADYFGNRHTGAILGILYTAAGIGALLGPVVAGAVFDARESYTLPILLAVVMNGVAMICIGLLPEPETSALAAKQPA